MQLFSFDDEYVRRLLAGDRLVEKHFFDYFRPRLLMKFRRSVHPPSEADDLTQRVFLIAYASLNSGKGPDDARKLGAWMHGVARNVLSEWYRAPKNDQFDPEAHETASEENVELDLISLERVALVRQVIAELDPPPRDREVIIAIYLEERDRDEVCRAFGIDRQYLRVLLHRALKRFKELVSGRK